MSTLLMMTMFLSTEAKPQSAVLERDSISLDGRPVKIEAIVGALVPSKNSTLNILVQPGAPFSHLTIVLVAAAKAGARAADISRPRGVVHHFLLNDDPRGPDGGFPGVVVGLTSNGAFVSTGLGPGIDDGGLPPPVRTLIDGGVEPVTIVSTLDALRVMPSVPLILSAEATLMAIQVLEVWDALDTKGTRAIMLATF